MSARRIPFVVIEHLDAFRDCPDNLQDIRPDQGFPAGKFYGFYPELCRHLHNGDDLISAHLCCGILLALGMAVDTGEVTPGGKADAEVCHRSSVRVPERFGHKGCSTLEILPDNINFCASFPRGFCRVGLYDEKVLPDLIEQFGKIHALE